MTMNKDIRKSLIESYLNAGTNPEQEQMLAEWFATHKADPDEEAASKLLLAEYPEAVYDAAEKEFDSIVASQNKTFMSRRIVRWACGIAACAAMLTGVGIFLTHRNTCEFNGLEIAQSIEKIMSLDMENVESISAKPKGNKVILTAVLNDGTRCLYEMSREEGSSAISITAMKY